MVAGKSNANWEFSLNLLIEVGSVCEVLLDPAEIAGGDGASQGELKPPFSTKLAQEIGRCILLPVECLIQSSAAECCLGIHVGFMHQKCPHNLEFAISARQVKRSPTFFEIVLQIEALLQHLFDSFDIPTFNRVAKCVVI